MNRRNPLKSVGASVVPRGIASRVRASEQHESPRREYKQKYSDSDSIKKAVSRYADALLQVLEDKNVIPESDVESLNIRKPVDYETYTEKKDAVHVSFEKSGKGTSPIIHVRRHFGNEEKKVLINILPEKSEAYAIEYPTDGTEKVLYQSNSDGDVSIMGPCATSSVCRARINQCYMWEVYCRDGYCGWGDSDGSPCGGWCWGSCGQVC